MRLIDADKIVNYRVTADDGKKYVLLPVEKLGDIPTAYDVDKVVKELEEESICCDYKLTECKGDYTDRCLRCDDCVVISKEAINIVKRGGIDEG